MFETYQRTAGTALHGELQEVKEQHGLLCKEVKSQKEELQCHGELCQKREQEIARLWKAKVDAGSQLKWLQARCSNLEAVARCK